MVLPTGKKVRILLTADDVIHAWWVPELGQKKDAIPGFVNEIWTLIEKARHLSRSVRGTVREGPRVHAHRRDRDAEQADYRQLGTRSSGWLLSRKRQAARLARVFTNEELMAMGEETYTKRLRLLSPARTVGGRTATVFPSLAGSAIVHPGRSR